MYTDRRRDYMFLTDRQTNQQTCKQTLSFFLSFFLSLVLSVPPLPSFNVHSHTERHTDRQAAAQRNNGIIQKASEEDRETIDENAGRRKHGGFAFESVERKSRRGEKRERIRFVCLVVRSFVDDRDHLILISSGTESLFSFYSLIPFMPRSFPPRHSDTLMGGRNDPTMNERRMDQTE
mmetsp:Transcript_14412/g.28992  ORF Transcript_14412/g.28992 Transcript_14412/m.28992 type:complete len:178 (+) Transcript_14412:916-1449(+)